MTDTRFLTDHQLNDRSPILEEYRDLVQKNYAEMTNDELGNEFSSAQNRDAIPVKLLEEAGHRDMSVPSDVKTNDPNDGLYVLGDTSGAGNALTDDQISDPEVEKPPMDPQDAELVKVFSQEQFNAVMTEGCQRMRWLIELKLGIEQHGVSRERMRMVQSLCDDLQSMDLEVPAVALENFHPNQYTPDQSRVNINVALEGLGQTIVNTVKAVIRKLIDYLVRVVRWFRQTFMGEAKLRARQEKIMQGIETLVDVNQQFYKELGQPDAKFSSLLHDHYQRIFSAPNLNANEAMAMLLKGGTYNSHTFDQLYNTGYNTTTSMLLLVEDLRRFVDGTVKDAEFDREQLSDTLIQLDAVNSIFTKLFVAQKADFLLQTDDVKNALYSVATRGLLPRSISEFSPYEAIVECYEEMAGSLKKIRQFNAESNADDVIEGFSLISRAVDDVARMASHLYTYNQTRMRLLGAIYNYKLEEAKLLQSTLDRAELSAAKRRMIDGIARKLEESLRRVMG